MTSAPSDSSRKPLLIAVALGCLGLAAVIMYFNLRVSNDAELSESAPKDGGGLGGKPSAGHVDTGQPK